jgi:glycosyltransferase involved in cell wall biosynthesis
MSLVRAMRRNANQVDVVHNHGLWSMMNVAAGWVVPGRRAKLVVSPRGTLAPWALRRTRLLKTALWPLQRRSLSNASLIHATSEMELSEVRALGFRAPVCVIPNGVDLPSLENRIPKAHPRTLLYLGRIHPKKGIDDLLLAWKRIGASHPDWQLDIVGRGPEAYEKHLRDTAAEADIPRTRFLGAVYGDEKAATYQRASLFVLPTHSENFGMVVAEALANECPAIVSRGAPWAMLETEGCGWWIERNIDSLAHTLDTAMKLPPEQLDLMGRKGRHWVEKEYDWDVLAAQMSDAYGWLFHGGPKPACIKLS